MARVRRPGPFAVLADLMRFPLRTLSGLTAILAAVALHSPDGTQAQTTTTPGETLIQCTTLCHGPELMTRKAATRGEWNVILQQMRQNGATFPEDQTPALLDYLVANYGPVPAGGEAGAANPDRYDVDFDWAELPPGMTWDASTTSIAADGEGLVYVLVRTAPHVRVFTREGDFVRAWGDRDAFVEAHSIMFDGEGNIWTTDSNGHAVYKFSPGGDLLMTLGTRGTAGDNASRDLFNRPNAVAIDLNGDIYVSDGYVNSRIVHFTPEGEFVGIIGGRWGEGRGDLRLPHGVVVDSHGRILVGDSDNQRISVFAADGRFLEAWPYPSRGGMLITEDDTLYVSDVNANAISVIDSDGRLIDTIGGLGRVHGITIDSDGVLYASDSLNRKVMKITRR